MKEQQQLKLDKCKEIGKLEMSKEVWTNEGVEYNVDIVDNLSMGG